MYTNDNLVVINNNDPYIGLNGDQYPFNFPKNEIPELYVVTEVSAPTDNSLVVTGFHIELDDTDPENLIYNQVWDTRAKTQQEIDGELAEAKFNKRIALNNSYETAYRADIDFVNANSENATYQASKVSLDNLIERSITFKAGTPGGFYWKAKNNDEITPFTIGDIENLIKAIGDRGWTHYQNLTTKKATLDAATTVTEVDAIEF